MTNATTMIRVPVETRDRLRQASARDGATFAALINQGLELINRERFWNEVASITPDQAYLDEFDTWADEAAG